MQKIGGTIEIMNNEKDAPGCCIRLTFPKHGEN
jgi:nitrogen fixation/metabolism regulation signal transduction histidine kinase